LALEQYPEALKSDNLEPVERAYSLYKSSRATEAKAVLEAEEIDVEEDRAAKVLLAQVVSLSTKSVFQILKIDPF